MNVEEIIKGIERVNRKYSASVMGLPDAEECEDIAALRAAISLLRDQQEPNAPLTLDELRGMDGEPVYIVGINGSRASGWGLVRCEARACQTFFAWYLFFEWYGKTWIAYRRRPEEVNK